jgi:hypothetical protein
MGIAIGHPRERRRLSWADVMQRRRRRMLACSFELALEDARRPPHALTPRVDVRRDQVLDAADEIEALVARLRDVDRPVREEALAEARALLRDGDGPVYAWAEPGTLRRRLRVVCEAVE